MSEWHALKLIKMLLQLDDCAFFPFSQTEQAVAAVPR